MPRLPGDVGLKILIPILSHFLPFQQSRPKYISDVSSAIEFSSTSYDVCAYSSSFAAS
jgi:hypothetical protein